MSSLHRGLLNIDDVAQREAALLPSSLAAAAAAATGAHLYAAELGWQTSLVVIQQ